jgi:hypothetical protein
MRAGVQNMKNENKEVPQIPTSKKPPRAIITKAEMRRRMKNIDEWRKKRLEELRKPHTDDSR